MDKRSIKLTVLFDGMFWVGIFERKFKQDYSVARQIFGSEPTDPEIYNFTLHDYETLRFSEPLKDGVEIVRIKNPKRMQREARRQAENFNSVSKAQDALRIELEKNKKQRKQQGKAERERIKQLKFDMKQVKKKKKKKGH